MLRFRLLVAAIFAVAMLAGVAAPAGAQGYTGWIENPYPGAGQWYCDYYGEEYWCWSPSAEQWFRATPNWYNANSQEMMDLYGVPVL